VALVQYKFTRKQYTEKYNETEYPDGTYITIRIHKHNNKYNNITIKIHNNKNT